MTEKTLQIAPDGLWENVCNLVRNHLATESERSQMDRYFPMFVSHELAENIMRIGVAEAIQVEWFSPLYKKPIEKALDELGYPGVNVVFEVSQSHKPSVHSKPAFSPAQNSLHKQS